jgi:hypothetical protein
MSSSLRSLAAAGAALVVVLSCAPASASGPVKLTAAGAAAGDNFGYAVSLSGDTLIVGANLGDAGGADSGSASIFRWEGAGWAQEATLLPSDAAAGDNFGYAVAIDGNTAIVGAYLDDDGGASSGSAYIFTRTGSTWTEQAKLTASDMAAGDFFGASVSIAGDTAIVGAWQNDDAGTSSGSAYVFLRTGSNWTQQAKLTALDAASGDQFGISVALADESAIVGANGDDDLGSNSGSAYIFTRTGSSWAQQAKLVAADGASADVFGAVVAISGETAIVGANGDDDTGSNAGAAYVFTRSGSMWTQQAKLTAADGAASDRFGIAVALAGDTALVGAYLDDDAGADSGSAYVFGRLGSSWSQQAKLTAPVGGANDRFGYAVTISGDTAIVGAYLDDDTGTDSGSAHVFERIGPYWIGPDQKVLASDASALNSFGNSVAISGDTAIVAARGNDAGAGIQQGAAYIFTRSGSRWTQQAKISAADGAAGDFFGYSVALSGDTAIVGAYESNGAALNSGSAYVFTRSGSLWTQQAKLTAADGATGELFGGAVALSADTAIVAAWLDDDAGTDSGSAYIFTRSGSMWTQQAKIAALDGAAGDNFGRAVALSGDMAIVGAFADDAAGSDSGSAYIFTRSGSTWAQQAKLIASDGAANDLFGISVALWGDTAIIGANGDDDGGASSGAAYIFVRSGSAWSQQAKLTASDKTAGDSFGWSVALSGDRAIVGANGDGDAGSQSGSAYIFRRSGTTWIQHGKLAAIDGAADDQFGYSVALSGDTAIAGAYADKDFGLSTGSAWFLNIGEECLPPFVHNTTVDTLHDSLSQGINSAGGAHVLSATAPAFWDMEPTDYLGKLLSINSRSRIRQPYLNSVTLANGASLNAASGQAMILYGAVTTPQGADATLRAGSVRLGSGGDITVRSGASLTVESPTAALEGDVLAFDGAALTFTGGAATSGQFTLLGGELAAQSFAVMKGGRFLGDGDLITSVTNSASFITVDSTLISGDLTNNTGATVTVQIGTLTLLGNLTNNGTIVGDLQTLLRAPQTQPGDGFGVGGDYTAGPGASLLMSSDLWRITIGGDFDVAINDNTRYDMAQATLRIGAGAPSSIERMSTDIGPSPDGLDRTIAGHYPIGTLRLTGNVTNLVDAHDNDNLGQATCEAVYVRTLIIDAGATLNTNGCPVYYETLTNNGTVDDPANLIQIAQCAADLTGDGQVDGADLGLLLGSWGGAQGDLTGDGFTDGADLGLLLGAWGACP